MPEYSDLTVRSRSLSKVVSWPVQKMYNPKTKLWSEIVPKDKVVYPGKQITASEGHPWPPKHGIQGDLGGPFQTSRVEVWGSPTVHYSETITNPKNGKVSYFRGPAMIHLTPDEVRKAVDELPAASSDEELSVDGTNAIAYCAPAQPTSEAGTALLEFIKDAKRLVPDPPTWQRLTDLAKSAGDLFLNAEFGWLPMVADVEDFSKSVANADRILSQYERDMGRNVRRTFDYPIERTVERAEEPFKSKGDMICHPGTSGYTDTTKPFGVVTRTQTTERRKWFSGCFTYGLPSNTTSWGRMRESANSANHLVGTSLTPHVLWELAPWSWAIDWFSNTQEVMDNLSAWTSAGQVLRYGYMMEEVSSELVFQLDRCRLIGFNGPIPPFVIKKITKTRVPAGPFGFGIGWEGLSPTQLLITAALGITRVF